MGPPRTNKIERIENLEFLPNLRFLTLAHNFITEVEGLVTLPKLGFLDLSHNFVEKLDVDELPKSLVFLNMTGNLCTHLPEYTKQVTAALPKLKQLDNEFLGADAAEEEEGEATGDDDDGEGGYEYVDSDEAEGYDVTEDKTGETTSAYFPDRKLEDMLALSQQRTEEQYREHKHNLKLLGEYRENTQVLLSKQTAIQGPQ